MLSNCSHQPALLVTVTLVAGLVNPVIQNYINKYGNIFMRTFML